MQDTWNDALVSRLRELWTTSLSAAQIALDLGNGISRNAILGKAMRLKLPPRLQSKSVAPTKPAAAMKKRPVPLPRRAQSNSIAERVAIAKSEPGLPQHLEEPAAGNGIKLNELNELNCHWPKGDPRESDFEFCGGAVIPGKPYCAYHCRVAFVPPQDRKKSADVSL